MMLKPKNKKGVSVLIGYVLLIVFAIIISIGVYSWLSTYVPKETLSCQDGISLFVKDLDFNASISSQLNITIKNNGRFGVAGYFIHAKNSSNQSIAILDLSRYLNEGYGGTTFGSAVLFSVTADNSFDPGEEVTHVFNIPTTFGDLYSVEILPTIFQTDNNRERFVSCSEEKVEQQVGIGACTPDCTGRVCGSDGCGGICGTCSVGSFCDAVGSCIVSTCTPAADPTLLGICGTYECGTATNGTCGAISCGTCSAGFSCNSSQMCESTTTCNGVWSPPESPGVECDGGASCFADCTCPIGYNPDGVGGCTTGDGTYSIDDYCISLGYTTGACVSNNGGCTNQGGELVSGGDVYCSPQLGCCKPAR